MNYSAILVIALPGRLQDVITAINRIEGVDAHISDPDSDRLICTIEAQMTKSVSSIALQSLTASMMSV